MSRKARAMVVAEVKAGELLEGQRFYALDNDGVRRSFMVCAAHVYRMVSAMASGDDGAHNGPKYLFDRERMVEPVADHPAPKRHRGGFGAISPERRREIARMGGQASQALVTVHRWTPEQAREAGRKGGLAARARQRAARAGGES